MMSSNIFCDISMNVVVEFVVKFVKVFMPSACHFNSRLTAASGFIFPIRLKIAAKPVPYSSYSSCLLSSLRKLLKTASFSFTSFAFRFRLLDVEVDAVDVVAVDVDEVDVVFSISDCSISD